ncbi:MAG: hypothetical protein A3J28_18105 [Acidobacteria bacterium RIFCSPLOWO2_12_FULL_60_22]|nr:MAG: hypothetical protein A3J28_18105 [Acidobacteria bacterium RIFCSPLOWO2_12_FULL_60_22]
MATPASTLARDSAGAQTPPPPPATKRTARWRRQTFLLAVGTALAAAALAWLLSRTSPMQLLELKAYDMRFALRGQFAPPSNMVLVTIDDRTEAAIPAPRIFWHPQYASLLRAITAGNAKAIGLDVFFATSVEDWAPGMDRELAAAFAEVSAALPVVLAYDTLQPSAGFLPLYILGSAQGMLGFANFTQDRDGFIRRQELQSRGPEMGESLAARLAAVVLRVERGVMDSKRRTIRFGNRAVPLDPSGFLILHYWGPAGTFPTISMADVLASAARDDRSQLEKWFRDKIVLVGTLESADRQPTPFYLAGRGQDLMPGVEIQASALATILEQRFLREAPPSILPLLLLAASCLATWFIFRFHFPVAPLLLLGSVSVYLGATVWAQRSGLVLPAVPPVLAALLSGLASYGAYALTEGRKRRLLQDVFGRYVSRDVAQELLTYGEIPLGGVRQPVTVLFSDLRNYTGYCEGLDPHLVVKELNEYFADMTAEIKAHGGMVNKFIGDGIMALFGAPLPRPDDASRAVACALRMVQRNEEYNRRRAEQGLKPLVIGIGLHTGDAVVGTIGAPEKMEYTAIGNTVNVASRIEGENKTFQSRLLVSESTYQLVRERVVAEATEPVKLKGISAPVVLYKILEWKGEVLCSADLP